MGECVRRKIVVGRRSSVVGRRGGEIKSHKQNLKPRRSRRRSAENGENEGDRLCGNVFCQRFAFFFVLGQEDCRHAPTVGNCFVGNGKHGRTGAAVGVSGCASESVCGAGAEATGVLGGRVGFDLARGEAGRNRTGYEPHPARPPRAGKWKQTWVDNEGGYLDFVGEFKDGQMILGRAAVRPDGTKALQRMVFKNITHNEFDWSWESSTDGGKTWQVQWPIHYKRKGT